MNRQKIPATLDGQPRPPLNGPVTDILHPLEATLTARRNGDPATSYVARLYAGGVPLIARKLGEEAVETIVAALSGDEAAVTAEAADLIFHLLVLINSRGVSLADVEAELARRAGVSGIAEKAGRAA